VSPSAIRSQTICSRAKLRLHRAYAWSGHAYQARTWRAWSGAAKLPADGLNARPA